MWSKSMKRQRYVLGSFLAWCRLHIIRGVERLPTDPASVEK